MNKAIWSVCKKLAYLSIHSPYFSHSLQLFFVLDAHQITSNLESPQPKTLQLHRPSTQQQIHHQISKHVQYVFNLFIFPLPNHWGRWQVSFNGGWAAFKATVHHFQRSFSRAGQYSYKNVPSSRGTPPASMPDYSTFLILHQTTFQIRAWFLGINNSGSLLSMKCFEDPRGSSPSPGAKLNSGREVLVNLVSYWKNQNYILISFDKRIIKLIDMDCDNNQDLVSFFRLF